MYISTSKHVQKECTANILFAGWNMIFPIFNFLLYYCWSRLNLHLLLLQNQLQSFSGLMSDACITFKCIVLYCYFLGVNEIIHADKELDSNQKSEDCKL